MKFVFPLMCSEFPDLKEPPRLEGFRMDLVGRVPCLTGNEGSFGGVEDPGTDEVERCVLGRGMKFGV